MVIDPKKTILLIEDNPDDVFLTLRAFKANNIDNEIIIATDGAEAKDMLTGNGTNAFLPEVILLDLKLPKIDGLELLKFIRQHGPTKLIPVIILTSSNEEQDLIKSYLNGANSYIRKPVDYKKFIDAVKELGIYWLGLNENPPKLSVN
ncbi:MAG: response regulator [Candidatus Kapaibacterium sp.]